MTRSEFVNLRDSLDNTRDLVACAFLAATSPADSYKDAIVTVLGMAVDQLEDAKSNIDEHLKGISP